MATDNSQIAQACSNLQQIKNGQDPRSDTMNAYLRDAQREMDRLFEQHEMPRKLTRSDVSVYVTRWQGKIGNCKYNQYIEPDAYGKRVSSTVKESRNGHYAIGIAKRAFESGDKWADTVAHELAHVTAYIKNNYISPGHGSLWQSEARRLGADASRTGSVDPDAGEPDPYYLACPECESSCGKQRRSKRIQQPYRYSCSVCGTKCVSYERGDEMPSDPGTCAVDCSDL